MKKRIFAIVMSACLLITAFTSMASAAVAPEVATEIPIEARICPGAIVEKDIFGEIEFIGTPYSHGWEIKVVGGDWIPYDGEPLDKYDDGCSLRYFACNSVGDYSYSNECLVKVAHNPTGPYKYNGTDHWRECADCGGQANKGAHTHLDDSYDPAANICTVCGNQRAPQYTGIKAFLNWIMALVASLLG